MRIQHNITALNANRNLNFNNNQVGKSLEKLSSGYRINRAGDDAAGLAISEKMRAQISCLSQAETNCNDGISLIQTAEGALTEVHDMLNRMVELAEQSANGTYTDETDRENLESELDQLKSEIDRISDATNFNGINLLDGTLGGYALDKTSSGDIANISVTKGSLGLDATLQLDFTKATNTLAIDKVLTKTEGGNTAAITLADAGVTATTSSKETNSDGTTTHTFVLSYTEGTAADAKGEADGKALDGLTITVTTKGAADVTDAVFTVGKDTDGDGNSDTLGNGLTLQIGDTADDFNKLTVNVDNMDCATLGVKDISIKTQEEASDAIEKIKSAINSVSSTRGDLGAMQNRLEHTVNNLSVTNENITNAESRIRDTDMAKEMMAYTSKNILSQAAQSMLAQANQQPQQVLSLLQ